MITNKHLTAIVEEHITLSDRERVKAWRMTCSCGFVGTPQLRVKIAENDAKHHVRTADFPPNRILNQGDPPTR